MKKYTQEEFDNFTISKYDYKICPSGNYVEIKNFGPYISFGEHSDFGAYSIFGEWCDFGANSNFGANSDFGAYSIFGPDCNFGANSDFGAYSIFGPDCNFENGRVINGKYFACDRIGSEKRKTYFFKGDNGYFVRAGCFFGTLNEFIERVHEVHAGTKHETEYIKAVELAKAVLG